jgi:16S rRNA (cytosine967-C5)-methyltransferase
MTQGVPPPAIEAPLVSVGCAYEDALRVKPLVVRAYEEERARGWPFLSDVLERALRGVPEEDRAAAAIAVHAMVRYDRLLAFASGSDAPDARFEALFATARGLTDVAPRIARIENAAERAGVTFSVPDWMAELVNDPAMLARMNEAPARTLRVNTLRTTRDACLRALADEGLAAHPTPYASQGLVLEPGARRSPFRTQAFSRGDFEMQDEASQLVAELVSPPPRSAVVDACAGAGGKTLALAALLGGKGRVFALDASREKLAELQRRARRAGAGNAEAIEVDLLEPGASVPGLTAPVARVLVDAPCTGLGAIRRNPEARWRLRPEDVPRLVSTQAALLRAAAPLVAPRGRLVYAVCSFLPVEGERIVEAFLAENADFRPVTARDVLGRARTERVATSDGRYLHTWQEGGPEGLDGFFAAVLRKVESGRG